MAQHEWRDSFSIVWHAEVTPEIERKTYIDIANNLSRLKAPADLVTHSVFLSDDYEGPSVSV